jgi:hypothetical protein
MKKVVEAWAGVWNRGGISLHFTEHDACEHLDGRGEPVRLIEAAPLEAELRRLRKLERAAVNWKHLHSPFAEYEHERQLRRVIDANLKAKKQRGKK